MIFYLVHNIIHYLIPGNFSDQTRNLTTFLIGIILYTWVWSYLFGTDRALNTFLYGVKGGFAYILIADCMAMGILFKNYYQFSILNEISQTVDLTNAKLDADDTQYKTFSSPVQSTTVDYTTSNNATEINRTTEVDDGTDVDDTDVDDGTYVDDATEVDEIEEGEADSMDKQD